MAAEKSTTERRSPSAFLIVLITVLVILIAINVANALRQSSLNGDLTSQDIYTLETDQP